MYIYGWIFRQMMIRQPRLPDPAIIEAYPLMQQRYRPNTQLEAIAARPYEPVLKTSSFREAFAQAYSKAREYLWQPRTTPAAAYLDGKMQPVPAVAHSRVKSSADYLKSLFTELSDRVIDSIERDYLKLTRYTLSSYKGSLEVGDPKRLAFLVAIIVMLGAAGYVWYPRLFSKRPPVRIEQQAPPLIYHEAPVRPVPAKPAEPPTFYKELSPKPATPVPAKPAPTYSQMPIKPAPKARTAPRKTEAVKPAPKPRVGEIFTHEIATEPETIIPK